MTAVVEDLLSLRAFVQQARGQGQRVALVPTMGALHDGHMALVRAAQAQADICVVSIFVNPMQFAPHEDFEAYPRTWESDLKKVKSAGAQIIWAPSIATMYPKGAQTCVRVGEVAAPLEGEFRPHFFEGVATVVTKLLLQVQPHIALFGEKDYQQLQVIRTLARDLDMPVDVVGVPTVRDAHGLALSSRNAYLSESELKVARQINVVLAAMRDRVKSGTNVRDAEAWATQTLAQAGFQKIDYCAVRSAETLQAFMPEQAGRILFAGWLGKARLIDNIPL